MRFAENKVRDSGAGGYAPPCRYSAKSYKANLDELGFEHAPEVAGPDPGRLRVNQLRVLMKNLEPDWQALISFLTNTGCRMEEAFRSRIRDLDWTKAPARIKFVVRDCRSVWHRVSFYGPETVFLLDPLLKGKNANDYLFSFTTENDFRGLIPILLAQSSLDMEHSRLHGIEGWTVHSLTFRYICEEIMHNAGMPLSHVTHQVGHVAGPEEQRVTLEQREKEWLQRGMDEKMRLLEDALSS